MNVLGNLHTKLSCFAGDFLCTLLFRKKNDKKFSIEMELLLQSFLQGGCLVPSNHIKGRTLVFEKEQRQLKNMFILATKLENKVKQVEKEFK